MLIEGGSPETGKASDILDTIAHGDVGPVAAGILEGVADGLRAGGL
jgi:hypothetical protein